MYLLNFSYMIRNSNDMEMFIEWKDISRIVYMGYIGMMI